MGYFPNGTSWEAWVPENCAKCANYYRVEPESDLYDPNLNCPIELVHLTNNYDQEKIDKNILNALIPIGQDGISNGKCRGFRAVTQGEWICDICCQEYYGDEPVEDWMEKQIQIVEAMNKRKEGEK